MPALELRSIDDFASDIPIPPQGYASDELWTAAESKKRLSVEVFVVEKGKTVEPRHHPEHITSVICWQGRGEARIAEPSTAAGSAWRPAYAPITVKPYTAFVVPRGALYEFTAAADLSEPYCILIVVHPLLEKDLETQHAQFGADSSVDYRWVKQLDPFADPPATDPETDEAVYQYDPDPTHRAKRMRIWGRDGLKRNPPGGVDIAKTDFHVVAYCFGSGQENPAHFHPYSVELMIGLKGDTLTYTRTKRTDATGWEENRHSGTIGPGDTALVRVGNLHRYVNHTNSESIVLAMQTPQPILHTLQHETDF
jgi:quercetin dioxygenase-like cupin family protein